MQADNYFLRIPTCVHESRYLNVMDKRTDGQTTCRSNSLGEIAIGLSDVAFYSLSYKLNFNLRLIQTKCEFNNRFDL